MNLLLNAADAVQEPSGTVRVRLFSTWVDQTPAQPAMTPVPPRPGAYVCLEVSDDGRGMSEETQRKIFEPFFSTKPAGRGLGLASTLGIVRSHRGGVDVESAPGRGARFRVYFPVPAPVAVAQDRAISVASSNRKRRPSRAQRLLLVDDDEAVLTMLSKLLARQGYSIHAETDRSGALAALERDPDGFDLILFDLMMPGMDAQEALWRLNQISPQTPVLLASGYSAEILRDSLNGCYWKGFLQKPFRRAELMSAIAGLTGTGTVGASATGA